MKGRLILLLVIGICVFWITYVSVDIVSKQNAVNFTEYFNKEDGKIVVIHHSEEVNWQENNLQVLYENKQILESFQKKLPKGTSVYISEKRPILIIEKSENWKEDEVNQLFQAGILPYERLRRDQLSFGKYEGIVSNNQILLHKVNELELTGCPLKPDLKSSYSLIYWQNEELVYEDYYCRLDKNILFKRYRNKNGLKQKLDDKQKFSGIIPADFNRYSFYTKEEFELLDSKFKNTVLAGIIEGGLVIIEKGNQKAVIFDFKENQNPVQSFNESLGLEEKNEDFGEFDSLSISFIIDSTGRKLYLAQFEEFGVLSYDKPYFDAILTEINLGTTLSMDSKKMELLFRDLPLQVSMRVVDSNRCLSKTHIGDQTIETVVTRKSIISSDNLKDVKDYFSLNPGEKILQFGCFDERGNAIVYTELGNLHGYSNGLKKWTQKLSEMPVSIELSDNRKYLLINLSNEALVYQKNGSLLLRIPKSPTVSPKIITFKGVELAFTVNSNTFIEYQLNGKISKQIVLPQEITDISYFKDLKNDQIILLAENGYFSYDLKTKKQLKKSERNDTWSIIGSNENHCLVSLKGNSFTWFDPLMNQLHSMAMTNFKVHDIIRTNRGNALLVSNGNLVQAILMNGQLLWKQNFRVKEINKIVAGVNAKGNTIIGMLDGIQNELFVFDENGSNLIQNSIHAEDDIKITTFGSEGYSITTFLGTYLIQYNR